MSAAPAPRYTEETVLWVKRYTPKLMSFAISRPAEYRFAAGQFSRLGFRQDSGFIWRAYSVVSAEYDDTLEYYAVLITGGPMSARFDTLEVGDTVLLDKNATGFLLPERFPDGNDLIMLCTGSGIAPFLSILQQPPIWQRFERVALAHSVSYADEAVFNQRIFALQNHPLVGEHYHKLSFVPVLTRERLLDVPGRRLPQLLEDGSLSRAFGMPFSIERSRFMLCGNPDMVKDTFQALLDMGFAMHRNRIPGQIMMENAF